MDENILKELNELLDAEELELLNKNEAISSTLYTFSNHGYKVVANNPVSLELYSVDNNTYFTFNKKDKTYYHNEGAVIDMFEHGMIHKLLVALGWVSE